MIRKLIRSETRHERQRLQDRFIAGRPRSRYTEWHGYRHAQSVEVSPAAIFTANASDRGVPRGTCLLIYTLVVWVRAGQRKRSGGDAGHDWHVFSRWRVRSATLPLLREATPDCCYLDSNLFGRFFAVAIAGTKTTAGCRNA